MESVFQIVLAAVTGCFLVCILRKYSPEYAVSVTVCLGIFILVSLLKEITEIKDFFSSFSEYGIDSEWLKSIIKITLICFVGQWGSGICSDIGEKSISDKIETAVKITVIIMCLPYIKEMLQFVSVLE